MDGINLLGMVYARWRKRASLALAPYGITLSQFQLIHLARVRGSIAPSMAAAELGSDRPTMTLVARACLRKGWLTRKASQTDRRSFKLSLTGHGEELLDRIEGDGLLAPHRLGDPFDILGLDERADFLRMLDRIERRSRDVLGG